MEDAQIAALVADTASRPSVWGWDGLWTPLVTAEETSGSYSIIEQLMPQQAGPPPHVHETSEEVFYLLEGEVRFQFGDSVVDAQSGQLVRIPRLTPHGFAVMSESARFLNFYSPAALDLMIKALSTPAAEKRIPTSDEQATPTEEQLRMLSERLIELATQSWTETPDLLADYRKSGPPQGPGSPKGSSGGH